MDKNHVNPDNINPHFKNPEAFGLTPNGVYPGLSDPQPCPSCGRCPTCGRGNSWPVYYGPWWGWDTRPLISSTSSNGEAIC